MFAVDGRGIRDRRVVRRSASMQRDAALLLGRLRRLPGVVSEAYSPAQIRATVRELEGILREQDFYVAPGLDGVRDLLNDDVLAERVAARGAGVLGGRKVDDTEALIPLVEGLGEAADGIRLAKLDTAHRRTLPLELQVAASQDAAVEAALGALTRRGVGLRVQRLTHTPEGVLAAINLVAVVSQENFLLSWLPALVERGTWPHLKPTSKGMKRAREAGLIGRQEDPRPRLEAAVKLIEASVGEYLKVITEDGRDDLPELVTINRTLANTARILARRRMLFDNARARTEGAQAVIKALLVIGPIAHSLESMDLGAAAKVFTASADDLGAQTAEWMALRGSGYSRSELVGRAGLLLPVFGAATAGAVQSHIWLTSGHERLGGFTFGLSAVALSLTTAIQSIHMYRQGYETLLREGKIPGKIGPAMQKRFQRQLATLEKRLGSLLEPKNRPRLVAMISKSLTQAVAEGKLEEREKAQILKDLEGFDMQALVRSVKVPGSRERWLEAVRQDFSNPAHLGILLGSFAAPTVGWLAGPFLNNGWVQGGVGSTESIVAATTVFAAGVIDEARYRAELGRQLKASDATRRTGFTGFFTAPPERE